MFADVKKYVKWLHVHKTYGDSKRHWLQLTLHLNCIRTLA